MIDHNSSDAEDNNELDQRSLLSLKADVDMLKRLMTMEIDSLKTRVENITDTTKLQYQDLERTLNDTREKVRDALHISIGVDGQNGLRGTMNTVRSDLSAITKDLEFLRMSAHSYNSTKQLFTRLFTSTAVAIFIQLMGAIWFVSAMHSKQEAIREDLNRVLTQVSNIQQYHDTSKPQPPKQP